MTASLRVAAGLLAAAAALAAGAQEPPRARRQALPDEIVQFYADLNFVAAFSSRLERQHIRAVQRRGNAEDTDADWRLYWREHPLRPLSAREQEVAQRLARIERRTLRIDDIAILGLGMGEPAAELMRIVSFEWSGETLQLRVEAWPIGHEYVDRLVTEYALRGRRQVDADPPAQGRVGTTGLSAHRWRRVDGRWMRMEGVAVRAGKPPG